MHRLTVMTRLYVLVGIALIGLGICPATQASPFGNDVVTVTIKTVDSYGAPVPWVTIGSAWTPYPPVEQLSYWPGLQPSDLKRILLRNPDAWEYWNRYMTPVMMIQFTGLTDEKGILKDQIDYVASAGSRSHWPSELVVAYGAYRHGYQPTFGQVTMNSKSHAMAITLVVDPEADNTAVLPEYLQTLYEVRHELADWRHNEDISMDNYQRLEGLRRRLFDAVRSALAQGDRVAAARIAYWVAYMPEVTLFNGKPTGFSQVAQSLRNYEAIQKAASYDPANAHIQAQAMLYESWWWDHENNAGRISYDDVKMLRRQWLDRAVALDKSSGPFLWARFHEDIANTYAFFGMNTEAIAKLEWLQRYDPSWSTGINSRIGIIKRLTKDKP